MDSYYFELTVKPSAFPERFLDFINDIFPFTIEELDNTIILRSADDDLEDISWAIKAYAEALAEALGSEVTVNCTIEKKENIDWIKKYQQSVQPIEVGEFYIHPSWDEPKSDLLNVVIDPALAFGSGHHPTTASCLEAISSYVNKESFVLDVGCGSGILGIAAAKKGAVVDLCDTDAEAMIHTKENFEKNGVKYHNSWQGSMNKATQSYDVVIANIVADVLGMISSDIFKGLKDDGVVILSGILDKYEEKVIKSYKKFKLKERITKDEWVTLIMTK